MKLRVKELLADEPTGGPDRPLVDATMTESRRLCDEGRSVPAPEPSSISPGTRASSHIRGTSGWIGPGLVPGSLVRRACLADRANRPQRPP
ncbi:hypothetical protein AB0I81_00040 [Nonomuraea sp. NPDC050404]|uniref:hypothetical protein n=1 Tax=Nonomuraea sp. NPDC050404 TaxID=3155783 RepID=UPI00340F7A39